MECCHREYAVKQQQIQGTAIKIAALTMAYQTEARDVWCHLPCLKVCVWCLCTCVFCFMGNTNKADSVIKATADSVIKCVYFVLPPLITLYLITMVPAWTKERFTQETSFIICLIFFFNRWKFTTNYYHVRNIHNDNLYKALYLILSLLFFSLSVFFLVCVSVFFCMIFYIFYTKHFRTNGPKCLKM